MIKKVNDFVLGIGITLISLFLIISPKIVEGSVGDNNPGGFWSRPDVYIRILAVVMLIPAVILIIKSISIKKSNKKEKFSFAINDTILISLGLIVVYAIVLPLIGFVISTLIMIFALNLLYSIKEQNLKIRQIEKKKLIKMLATALIYSVISVIALYFIFTKGLNVQLP